MIDIRSMTNEEFKQFTKGKFFSAKFIKKDGSLREYKGARVEVTKDSKFTVHNNVEHKKNLVSVYVPNEKRPRATLNLETVKELTFQGKTYKY
ncbi:hypothetical protein HWD03_gp094 [Alteromonas phage vB_AmeM_PT11-V22]|uniref:Uncharacterized protein n=1 Tax=Alteromonas phage vB_AmeM_PT11-V22 TaxID=2704031 RepID=A0A6C0R0K5_9CAUD|nr:hypothetical protein HWD03_gp094 [Alteromonas phage vB_AmeM_PT11-V22]QHZ59775.1 hypothetical protein [Alteromonas phage vB_AmeM_PT11-V22]